MDWLAGTVVAPGYGIFVISTGSIGKNTPVTANRDYELTLYSAEDTLAFARWRCGGDVSFGSRVGGGGLGHTPVGA
jgi:hypothetical protein